MSQLQTTKLTVESPLEFVTAKIAVQVIKFWTEIISLLLKHLNIAFKDFTERLIIRVSVDLIFNVLSRVTKSPLTILIPLSALLQIRKYYQHKSMLILCGYVLCLKLLIHSWGC